MNTLIRHIEYLISRKDCVIIPGFGAILGSYKSAEYDLATQTYLPPKREFAFNKAMTHNDGLLVTSVQRAEDISYDCALQRIQAAVENMRYTLVHTGRLSLGHLGTISYNQNDGEITFSPAESDVLSVDTMWLRPIAVSEIEKRQSPVIKPAPIRKWAPQDEGSDHADHTETYHTRETASHMPHRRSRFAKVARTAAAIALLIGIGFMTSTPIAVDQDAMQASLAPEISQVTVEDILPPIEVEQETEIIEDITPVEEAVVEDEASNCYYIVVATTYTPGEAERFIASKADDSLKVLSKGPYYKVYSSSHPNFDEALIAIRKTVQKYPDAWVDKVK